MHPGARASGRGPASRGPLDAPEEEEALPLVLDPAGMQATPAKTSTTTTQAAACARVGAGDVTTGRT